jgi:oligogalacturonide lyase
MKAIIIGAGHGRRLMPTTAGTPKCYAEVHGRRLLDWAVKAFADADLTSICFIWGYQIEKVRRDYPQFTFRHNVLFVDPAVRSKYPESDPAASLRHLSRSDGAAKAVTCPRTPQQCLVPSSRPEYVHRKPQANPAPRGLPRHDAALASRFKVSEASLQAFALALMVVAASAFLQTQAAENPPIEWIEPATKHRVVRLSREPGTSSFYFHQNGYTESGDKLVVETPDGLSTIDLKTLDISLVVTGRAGNVVVGRKSRQVFYRRGESVYATHLDTRSTREVARLPTEIRGGSGLAVNADETLLAGSYVTGPRPTNAPPRGSRAGRARGGLEARWALHLPMRLYTINIKSGEVKTFHSSTNWLNHVQFSPTDPGLIMFCHEGPWHKVDRIWTIRADGRGLQKIHARAMDMEIAGHEFFAPDGKTIWYDLQTPKSGVFWLEGHVLATREKIKYSVAREHWSVHYNVSPDGKLFAGDGGGPNSVANRSAVGERLPSPGNGQWIYMFTPRDGKLEAERLVDLSKHDYELEPNVTFTPDGEWIVFRSNMHGATHVYAVEVKKAK